MPNRILREGILTSRRVDWLSERAELFYRRLMSRLDDYGRCEADVELMRSSCYPLRVDRVKAKHIDGWLEECRKAVLLVIYNVDGKRYLQYLDWKQQERSPSKFPAPDKQVISDAKQMLANEQQMLANEHLVVVVSEGVVGVVSEGGSGGSAPNGARHASQTDESPTVIKLPLRDGSEFDVKQSLVAELIPLYPAVDVPQTLNEMKGWLLGNPSRRKTRDGSRRFITNWLKTEQEKHGG